MQMPGRRGSWWMRPGMAISGLSRRRSIVCRMMRQLPRVIFIRKGMYQEKVFIEKNNLVLEGEDKEQTIISFVDGTGCVAM